MFEGHHYQVAYVTRDIDKAMADFRTRASIRHETYFETEMEVSGPNGTAIMHNKLSLLWVGNVQYEFIEHVKGLEGVYHPALPADGSWRPAFHHVCSRIVDWDDFRRRVDQQDMPVAFEGNAGPLKFLYLDGRAVCGHYLEYTSMPDEMWAHMGGL